MQGIKACERTLAEENIGGYCMEDRGRLLVGYKRDLFRAFLPRVGGCFIQREPHSAPLGCGAVL